MIAGILGTKQGMTRVIDATGIMVPATIIKIEDNDVLQVKTTEKDNATAIVLGASPYKKPSKNQKYQHIEQFDVADATKYTKGDKLTIDALKDVELVTVASVSKGRGFQGVVKRYGFQGGPMSHGSHFHREPGSIGQRTKPGKVMKGKKLPGHMGVDRKTYKNKLVLQIDAGTKLLYIKGSVAGSKNTLVEITY